MHVPDMQTDEDQSHDHSQEESVGMASTTKEDIISERIVEAVLDALKLQLELELSQIGFEKILDWGKKLFLVTHPNLETLCPKNWSECEKVLKKWGMKMQNSTLLVLMSFTVVSMV